MTFKGQDASKEALLWVEELPEKKEKKKAPTKSQWIDLNEQIGSDEVGVGDFFFPMIVVAAKVRPSDLKKLRELGVDDSKRMTDKKIMEIGPALISNFEYSALTLSNQKYNEMIEKGENLNSLKAKMHNRALANLLRHTPDIYRIYVDQFCSEKKFYSYLGKDDEPIVKGIAFLTKGETYFPSVALASVIARYSFLKKREELNQRLEMELPLGASSRVDKVGKELLEKVGQDRFDKLVKKSFKNYLRIVEK